MKGVSVFAFLVVCVSSTEAQKVLLTPPHVPEAQEDTSRQENPDTESKNPKISGHPWGVVSKRNGTVSVVEQKEASATAAFAPQHNKQPWLGSWVWSGVKLFGTELPPIEIPKLQAMAAVIAFFLGFTS